MTVDHKMFKQVCISYSTDDAMLTAQVRAGPAALISLLPHLFLVLFGR